MTQVLKERFQTISSVDIQSMTSLTDSLKNNFFSVFSTAVEPVKCSPNYSNSICLHGKNNPVDIPPLFPTVFFQHPDSCTFICPNTK